MANSPSTDRHHWAAEEMVKSRNIATIRAFCADRTGVTAIEYGLIAGVVGLVTAAAMSQIGSLLSANYFNILASLF
jgi:Flp pilus assembly pilin Flp